MKIIKNIYKRVDERGIFIECINSDENWKSVNGGSMKKDALMGNHYHKKCKALFFLLSGSADVFIKNFQEKNSAIEQIHLNSEEGIIIDPYEAHAWKFKEDSYFILLKSEKFDENNKDIHESVII